MSPVHDNDNDEHLFDFDICEGPNLLLFSTSPSVHLPLCLNAIETSPRMSSHDGLPTCEETSVTGLLDVDRKGKGVTKPMPIPFAAAAGHSHFDMAQSSSTVPSTSSGSRQSFPITPLTPSYLQQHSIFNDTRPHDGSFIAQNVDESTFGPFNASSQKGKQKASPPVLPPLIFSPTELTYLSSFSPSLASPSIASSSYTSSCAPTMARPSASPEVQSDSWVGEHCAARPPISDVQKLVPRASERHPIRHRSLSSLSVRSDQSIAARSMTQLKLKLSRPSSNLARKLLLKKTGDQGASGANLKNALETSNPPDRWRTGFKVDELDAAVHLPDLHLLDINSKLPDMFFHNGTPLKHKGRSKSFPLPKSALDYVPILSADTFFPLPLITKNYFDEYLPRELRLRVLEALVSLHEADYLRTTNSGRWSISKASSSRNKWVGRGKGFRELVKFSRISKAWQSLAFDGQLWVNFDLHSFPEIQESLILRMTTVGGQCVRTLNVSGHSQISAATLLDMTDHFCVNTTPDIDSLCYTQLTTINLQGCSFLTTRSLHHLLVCSRFLQKLCLKGLPAVTNVTCNIISSYCPQLVSLDISRCVNMDAAGIKHMADAAKDRGEFLLLKELRMCGLKDVHDDMMAVLGQVTPFLEVLDLSYARQLHNSALEAFVSCKMHEISGIETVLVLPRDIGREVGDVRFRRRVTRLRHLSLSSCLLLTDDVCANLAHAVPRLEFLELAGIGPDIKPDGLIRLLNTTPHIRRLDLEDASHITDAVLAAITPGANLQLHPAELGPEPGHALEQLNVSFATEVTDDAILALIRGCTRLKQLEADNTRISTSVLKEFVRQCRKRKVLNAKAVAVDCRGISESSIKDLSGIIRPRMGLRAYEFRKLSYLDARDGNMDELKVGQDECDEKRVVLKSFYSWQTVDAVKFCREKRLKASKHVSGQSAPEIDVSSERVYRWWTPGGRRTPRSSSSSPLNMADLNSDGCRMM